MRFDFSKLSRREIFKLSMMSGSATLIGARSALGQGATCSAMPPMPYDIEIQTGLGAIEVFPISPFILHPFNDPLPVPTAMRPGYRQSDGTLTPTATNAWYLANESVARAGKTMD